MQLQLSETRYVYPDVTITCDARDEMPEDNKTHFPSVVIEVLSPGTEAIDRGKKLLYYQAHPTIQEYVIADSQSMLIEIYHRERGKWAFSTHEIGDEVRLASLDVQFAVHGIYERTSLIRKAGQH